LIQYFYERLLLAKRGIIDVASEGALIDKTPLTIRQLISNIAEHTQQFHFRNSTRAVHKTQVTFLDNERIDNA